MSNNELYMVRDLPSGNFLLKRMGETLIMAECASEGDAQFLLAAASRRGELAQKIVILQESQEKLSVALDSLVGCCGRKCKHDEEGYCTEHNGFGKPCAIEESNETLAKYGVA